MYLLQQRDTVRKLVYSGAYNHWVGYYMAIELDSLMLMQNISWYKAAFYKKFLVFDVVSAFKQLVKANIILFVY